jgi:hypothetical protein
LNKKLAGDWNGREVEHGLGVDNADYHDNDDGNDDDDAAGGAAYAGLCKRLRRYVRSRWQTGTRELGPGRN